MTIEECADSIGRAVVYRAPHQKRSEPGDEGVITSANGLYAFVRYGSDKHSKATAPAMLALAVPS